MKSIRNIAFSALLTIGAFTAITYTACNKDECKDVVCENGGTCVNGTCECPIGYEGANCEKLTRDNFVGKWSGSDVCGLGTYNVELTIDKSGTNSLNALVTNPGGFGTPIVITGEVTATNKLSFTNASVGNGKTLTGSMTFSGNSMTFQYTVTGTIDSDQCNGSYTRK